MPPITVDALSSAAMFGSAAEHGMSRRERLERWTEILRDDPARPLKLLDQIEYKSGRLRSTARADGSPIALAFADPAFRREGLTGDTLGEAEAFFGLSSWEAHHILCICHFGCFADSAQIAERVSEVARRPTFAASWAAFRNMIARIVPHF